MPSLTARFCTSLTGLASRDLPPDTRTAARRTLLNVLGTAIGAGRQEAVEIVVGYGTRHGGQGVVPLPGRSELLDLPTAALGTGVAAHLDDFDDTHLGTVIHPGAATLGALLPLAVYRGAAGGDVLRAFALGCEAQLRLGNVVSPSHYDAGWHITGTCGVVGAAVAAGVLGGFDASCLENAVSLAVSQTLGHRESFGSMTKPFHPGKAAANGMLAALLAERGFRGPADPLGGPGGFLDVMAGRSAPDLLLKGLGTEWELAKNTFKPYPCGVVSHPAVDAAIELSAEAGPAEGIEEIVLRCHPLVPELMGLVHPADGMQARFSAAHTVASALLDGELTLRQFRDSAVARPALERLRALVRFVPSERVARDEAWLDVRRSDGTSIGVHVPHARGSDARPLTDEELEAKVGALIDGVLPGRAPHVLRAVADLDGAASLARLMTAMTPSGLSAVSLPTMSALPHDRSDPRRTSGATATVAAFGCGDVALTPALRSTGDRLLATVVRRASAGSADAPVRLIADFVATLGTPPQAAVPGRAERYAPEWAATITAVAAAPGDPGKGVWSSSVPVAAAALAVAQWAAGQAVPGLPQDGASVKALRDSVLVGLETGLRLDRVLGDTLDERGWDRDAVCGHVAAVVAAGRVLGLGHHAMVHALGIASTQAAGLGRAAGTDAARLQMGKAAGNAAQAVLLARRGYTAGRAGLEGRRGLASLLTPGVDIASAFEGLGSSWLLAHTPEPDVAGPFTLTRTASDTPSTLHALITT